ncbi:helix-turn-helix transcriptional regulator [Dactylosporangium sp. NPDC005572]|uniref:helix-turn-helix domain-containing protein n=1 Tax=Dactylosporangium sp. NPDC005572 TaxID=3156889 RepID=UPI0033B135DC
MTEPPRPARDVLVGGAKAARERLGLRQEDVAKRLRELGLTSWLRGTVAQVEVGARRLTLQEFFLLALVYETTPAALVGGEDEELVALTTTTAMRAGDLRSLLSGQVVATDRLRPETGIGTTRATLSHAVGQPTSPEVGEAERYVARRLRKSVEEINAAAVERWGRSLSEERDRRLDVHTGVSARRLQALRGHVTRELLTELMPDARGRQAPAQPAPTQAEQRSEEGSSRRQ